jgi:5-formyltetrahydrofolate cyclo-ligase
LGLSYVAEKTSYYEIVSTSIFVQPLATTSKQEWRRWAKHLRSQTASPTLDYEIVKTLRNWPVYQNAKQVLTYLAFDSEISLAALHRDDNKTFYIPRAWEDNTLTVHALTKDLESHRYGFLQPPANAPVIDINMIDLVLVPGLCFDKQGTRLGYGKGHYDRLLPNFLHIPRVGITAEALLVEALPRDSFDVVMSHIVTEDGVLEL